MIDATDILPKSIQNEFKNINRMLQVNYNGKKYVRVNPYVIYQDDETGDKYQFDKLTWVEIDYHKSYTLLTICGGIKYLEVDQIIDRHSVDTGDSFREWNKFTKYVTECKDEILREKHLVFNMKQFFDDLGYDFKVMDSLESSQPHLLINNCRVSSFNMRYFCDCFKRVHSYEKKEIEVLYVKSYDEIESFYDEVNGAYSNYSDSDKWKYIYNSIQSGDLSFDDFVDKMVNG